MMALHPKDSLSVHVLNSLTFSVTFTECTCVSGIMLNTEESRLMWEEVGTLMEMQCLFPGIFFFLLPGKMWAHRSISSSNSTCCEFFFT